MFSATFPDDIQTAAQDFLEDYLFLTVGMVGGACSDVQQEFHQEGEVRGVNGPPRQGSNREDVGVCAGSLYSTRIDKYICSYLDQEEY